MELHTDLRQPARPAIGSADHPLLRILGLAATDHSGREQSTRRHYSFLSECECPDDCLRDHENE